MTMTPEQKKARLLLDQFRQLDGLTFSQFYEIEAAIAAAIREAVEEEREACAVAVFSLSSGPAEYDMWGAGWERALSEAQTRIRARSTSSPQSATRSESVE